MLNCNRIQLFSASLRVTFLIFESLRTHLKYQLEVNSIEDKKSF